MNDESETVNLSELDATAKGSGSKSQIGPRIVTSSVDLLVHFRTLHTRNWVDFNLPHVKALRLSP